MFDSKNDYKFDLRERVQLHFLKHVQICSQFWISPLRNPRSATHLVYLRHDVNGEQV